MTDVVKSVRLIVLFHNSLFTVLAVKRPQLRGLGRYKKRMKKFTPKLKERKNASFIGLR